MDALDLARYIEMITYEFEVPQEDVHRYLKYNYDFLDWDVQEDLWWALEFAVSLNRLAKVA